MEQSRRLLRRKADATQELIYNVSDTLFERLRLTDVQRSSGVRIETKLSSNANKSFIIRGIRAQIREALRLITIQTGEQSSILRNAQKFWLQWIQEAFPDFEIRTYFLPPVHIRRVPLTRKTVHGQNVFALRTDKQVEVASSTVWNPPSVQESDMIFDKALENVLYSLQKLSEINQEVFMCLSQFPFGSYLGESCFAPASAHLPLPTNIPSDWPWELRQGSLDVLIIHKQFGFVIFEIKAVRLNENASLEEQDQQVKRKLKEAAEQLKKAEVMLSHLISDITPSVRITKVIACPNLKSCQLQRIVSDNQLLKQDLFQCCKLKDPADVARFVICCDHLCSPETLEHVGKDKIKVLTDWWQEFVAGLGSDPVLSGSIESYQILISRFCGPASTVRVPCITEPRVSIKTLDQAVAFVGDCYTAYMTLFPEQIELLSRAPQRVFIFGPPGSGKTCALLLMAIQWLQEGKNVHVLSSWDRSLAASFVLYYLLEQIIQTQLIKEAATPGRVYLLQKNFTVEEDIKATLDELAHTTENDSLYLISDEIGPDGKSEHRAFTEFCVKLLHIFRNQGKHLYLWAVSCHHDLGLSPEKSRDTEDWEQTFFTRPLRSPPSVVREIKKAWEIKQRSVCEYSHRSIPDHTDGLPVLWVNHQSQEHKSLRVENCRACGESVARILLTHLRLGKELPPTTGSSSVGCTTPQRLRYKDVLILSRAEFHKDDVFIKTLSERGLPVRVMSDLDIKDMATACKDVIWATRQQLVRGLERKVIVCLDNYDDINGQYPFSRLHAMSRCTSQLIVVCPPL